jgi:hypothetical protein
MSAGAAAASYHLAEPTHDLDYLAPLFRQAVLSALAECNQRVNPPLEAFVYETYRSNELQLLYYARGRQVKPPATTVTNARSNLYSWHGYGLAVDVIHKRLGWEAGPTWFRNVANIFKQYDCKWGGDWHSADPPHFQWAACKPSPSDRARELIRTVGIEGVWQAVGATNSV